MRTATIGNHAKLTALRAERARIRDFYQGVLGCEITRRSDELDFFRLGDGFFFAVVNDDAVLPPDEQLKAAWLELKVDDPEVLTKRVRAFGVREIETWEKGRLYFQAPGGQVFRIAGAREDLSRFES